MPCWALFLGEKGPTFGQPSWEGLSLRSDGFDKTRQSDLAHGAQPAKVVGFRGHVQNSVQKIVVALKV